MINQIAVLINKDGKTGTIYEQGMVVVYEKVDENWEVKNKIIFNINTLGGMSAVRDRVVLIIESIGNCRIFLGKLVEGIPHSILKKYGFTIAEADGSPEEFLDELLEMVIRNKEKAAKRKPLAKTSIEPVALDGEGRYFIDLEKVQKDNPNISSKKALLPFLKDKPFYELKILCNHVPKWLESELESLNMKLEIERKGGNELEVKVCRQVCNQ